MFPVFEKATFNPLVMITNFGNKVLGILDRAISGKQSPLIGNLNREEAALRDCYEARNGVGAAAALYQAALAKRLAREEDHAADMVAIAGGNKPVPTAVAASIARLKSEGIPVQQKLIILQNAMARPATQPTVPVAPAPSFAPPPAAPAHAPTVPTSAYPLTDELNAISDAIDKTRFYREHKANLDSEHRRQCRDIEAIKPSKVPTAGGTIVEQLESISDSRAKVVFYRNNKAAIDLSFQQLNQNQ